MYYCICVCVCVCVCDEAKIKGSAGLGKKREVGEEKDKMNWAHQDLKREEERSGENQGNLKGLGSLSVLRFNFLYNSHSYHF